MLKQTILALVGGGIGAALREWLMLAVANLPGGFPMPIFVANMSACVFSALTAPGGAIGAIGKVFILTGILGGLSTFSTFIWGTHQMLANPAEQVTAIIYVVLSMIGGFMLVELGLRLGERLHRSSRQP